MVLILAQCVTSRQATLAELNLDEVKSYCNGQSEECGMPSGAMKGWKSSTKRGNERMPSQDKHGIVHRASSMPTLRADLDEFSRTWLLRG